jgi:hypothetical protein
VTRTIFLVRRTPGPEWLRALALMTMLLHDDRRVLDAIEFHAGFTDGRAAPRLPAWSANSGAGDVRLTLIHPCIGRRPGRQCIRSWQMEPLPPATLASLTPKDVGIRFYDDRMEQIPFGEPTDLVALSVETCGEARMPRSRAMPASRRAGRDGRFPRDALSR